MAEHLCRLLRLAILFASRRRDDLLPAINLVADDEAFADAAGELD